MIRLLFILLLIITETSFSQNVAFSQNVGIGVPNPQYKLEVNGAIKASSLGVDSFRYNRIIILGDSYSVPSKWPLYLNDSMPSLARYNQINYAVSGTITDSVIANYANTAHASRPAKGDVFLLFCYLGINDMGAGKSADTTYAHLKNLWAMARADNFKVVAFTVIKSLLVTEPRETQRQNLNKLIPSDPSLFDYLIDADAVFNPAIEFSDFADGTHLNPTGWKKFARVIANTIEYVPYNLTSADPISSVPHNFIATFKDAVRFCSMTTAQRDALINIKEGTAIYNTTTHKLNIFTTQWEQINSL